MSIDFEAAFTWTVVEIGAKIEEELLPGWSFSCEPIPGALLFKAEVFDDSGAVAWSEVNQVEHLVMLNAYAWVHLRRYPVTNRLPQWAPRRTEAPRVPLYTDFVVGSDTPEPEDLATDEIDSVYEKHTKS